MDKKRLYNEVAEDIVATGGKWKPFAGVKTNSFRNHQTKLDRENSNKQNM